MINKLSEIYKELGIEFSFPIVVRNSEGKETFYENRYGDWSRFEYDSDGNLTYVEYSDGYPGGAEP